MAEKLALIWPPNVVLTVSAEQTTTGRKIKIEIRWIIIGGKSAFISNHLFLLDDIIFNLPVF